MEPRRVVIPIRVRIVTSVLARFMTAVVSLSLIAFAILVRPLQPTGLGSHPRPAASYAAALRILDSLSAGESAAVASECRSEWLTHGARTPRVIVLLHGLTNCPAQFDSLARLAYADGATVLVPRLPHHGFADRMTTELALLEPRELCAFTDRVLDAAHGMGDSVTVAGLSIGGVLTAWAAQERTDVQHAVVIAPMLGWAGAPGARRTAALARVAALLPNTFIWWDDKLEQNLPGPRHVYPRFATRAVAATLVLGAAVTADAARTPPGCRSVAVVTVGGDPAVDNAATRRLAATWRAHGAAVTSHEFPAALHLSHDVVDPEQVGGNPGITYPVLLGLIGGR